MLCCQTEFYSISSSKLDGQMIRFSLRQHQALPMAFHWGSDFKGQCAIPVRLDQTAT